MKKLLFRTLIGGISIIVLTSLISGFDIGIFTMCMVLAFIAFSLIGQYVSLFEDPDKAKENFTRNGFFKYRTEDGRRRDARFQYYFAKRTYPILIIIPSAVFIGFCVERLLKKESRDIHLFTLVLGILLALAMIGIIAYNIHKKKPFFAKENIRNNAYVYLNILLSLMLIAG